MTIGTRSTWRTCILAKCAVSLVLLGGCRSKDAMPKTGTKTYTEFLSAFYTGLAGLQVGDDVRAESSLAEAVRLAPGEPAGWVDWGVLALRQRNFDAASERLSRAHQLAPNNAHVNYLLGLMESERGNSAAAITNLQQAVQADPHNIRTMYQLAQEIEREGSADSDEKFEQWMQKIVAIAPNNIAAQIELSRIAAKRGDSATLQATVERIEANSKRWPKEAQDQLAQLQTAAKGPQPRAAATRSTFLRNVLMRVPEFRNDLTDLVAAPGEGAQPMTRFVRLENPSSRPAPADMQMTFNAQTPSLAGVNASTPWSWSGTINLNGDDPPMFAEANAKELRFANGLSVPFPSGKSKIGLLPESVLPIDFHYDFKTDLVLAGDGGLRFYQQEDSTHFTDVTFKTKLSQQILQGSYYGAWAFDVEADGDLDVLLGTASGVPTVLQNNGDDTFTAVQPFSGIAGVRQFAWVDLNGDGNPDAAILDAAEHLHIYLNKRSGNFSEVNVTANIGTVKAITMADVSSGGGLSLVAARENGALVRLVTSDKGQHWATVEIAKAPVAEQILSKEWRLYAADLDNNGAVDLVLAPITAGLANAFIWMQNDDDTFHLLSQQAPFARIFHVADLKNEGRLALVGLTDSGASSVADSRGTKDYHWQIVRPRAKQSTGDQRINSFGIGGEIEVRSGLLVQRQPITSPQLHFGLGEMKQVDVARILWPNGSVRAEFALKADQQIVTEQRLKGSCPFLFAWNGQQMSFVKDSVPWGSAIGLRINALGAARIAATEEWYKISRDQLRARDGFYDLRVTGELWETYYYDSMALMTVDHPPNTEIFTDERFDVPPVKLAVTEVVQPQPITRAEDDNGSDVTETVSKLDGVYLDNFGRGQYQGVTRDHYVEVELPRSLPTNAPVWLIAKGWLHPSDSSVNVALGQGHGQKPEWLSLEVPDGHGGWRISNPNLGFPAGRNKICLINLTGTFGPRTPHKLRLRTNLEIYWDSIEWAQGTAEPMKIQRLTATYADLHYRGFSTIHQANASSPELPDYNHLEGTSPRWRDLEGFYTRFGDVRELLKAPDDRYVVMNAGDEMSLRFAVPPPPPAGWVRDFVIAGDGWIKDGDYNSTYSQTVLPYPYHAKRDYNAPPQNLVDDWVYRHHPNDWQTYQTRYVTSHSFRDALRNNLTSSKAEQ